MEQSEASAFCRVIESMQRLFISESLAGSRVIECRFEGRDYDLNGTNARIILQFQRSNFYLKTPDGRNLLSPTEVRFQIR